MKKFTISTATQKKAEKRAADLPLLNNSIRKGLSMGIDKELMDILVCPKCKGDLELTKEEDGLSCKPCALKYPIKEGIPIMLIDEALPL